MAIGTPVGFSNTSGSGTATPATVALPAISQPGVVLVEISQNSGSSTQPSPTGATATWTGTTQNTSGSTLQGTLYYADVTAADSGVTITSGITGSSRWTMGGLYIPGARTNNIVTAANFNASATTSIVFPGLTPVGSMKWVSIGVHRNNTTTPSSITGIGTGTTAGWAEYVDVSTNNATAPLFVIWAAAKDDALISSVQSSITLNSATATGTKISWGVAVEEIPSTALVSPKILYVNPASTRSTTR